MGDLVSSFKLLFETNMGLRKGERIVVFTDTIRPEETPSTADADRRERLHEVATALSVFAAEAYGNIRFITFPSTPASGSEPPEELWRAVLGERGVDLLQSDGLLARLLAKQATPADFEHARDIIRGVQDEVADVVIALANNSTSHTRFRALVNIAGGRFASLPNFDPAMFLTSMRVDWTILAERTRLLAGEINQAEWVNVACPNGTSMRFGRQGRTAAADDGLLTAPGSFGNLPAGEVYFAPVEGTSQGTMVLEYAPTRKLAAPLLLTVEAGMVTAIDGDEPHRAKLEQKFSESTANRNIAELGIGTNDRATRPDNILEAEKILGTIHIALGDNSGFGGTVNTPFHEDYVFYQPTVTLILKDGSEKQVILHGKPLF